MDPGSGGGGGGGGSSSGSSSSDSAPDCWDQADMEAPGPGPCGAAGSASGPLVAAAAEAQREHLSAAFSRQLNVNAKPFVPNVHAAEFVPSFLRGPAQPPPPSAGAAANNHGAGSGAGGPSGKRPGRGRKPAARAGAAAWGPVPTGDGVGMGCGQAACLAGPGDPRPWGSTARGALTAASAVLGGAACVGRPRLRARWGGRGAPGTPAGPEALSSSGGHSYPLDVGAVGDRAGATAVSNARPRSEDRWSQESVGWAWRNSRSWGGRMLEFSFTLGLGQRATRCNFYY